MTQILVFFFFGGASPVGGGAAPASEVPEVEGVARENIGGVVASAFGPDRPVS